MNDVNFFVSILQVLSVIVDYKYLFWMYDPESESFKIEKSKVDVLLVRETIMAEYLKC